MISPLGRKTGFTVKVINDYGKVITSWHRKGILAFNRARSFIPYLKNISQIEVIDNVTKNTFVCIDRCNFVLKPYTFDDLEKRIRTYLRKSNL